MIDIILSLALSFAAGQAETQPVKPSIATQPEKPPIVIKVIGPAKPKPPALSADNLMLKQMLDDLPTEQQPEQTETSDDSSLKSLLDDLPSREPTQQAETSGDSTLKSLLDDLPSDEPTQQTETSGDSTLKSLLDNLPSDEPTQQSETSGDSTLKSLLDDLPSDEPAQKIETSDDKTLKSLLDDLPSDDVSTQQTEPTPKPETAQPKTLDRKLPMPLDQFKNIINLTKTSWIGYRDYDGKQLIYFTHLESWNCGISEVKYGFNGGELDKEWKLQDCDLAAPNAVNTDRPYISLELNSVQSMDVQLTFDDGSQTAIETFAKP